MSPFYLIWQYNDAVIRGQQDGSWVDGELTFPVSFPGEYSSALRVTLRSSARDTGTFETLQGLKLYLQGSDAAVVQQQWPVISADRPELNGGFEISFDNGRTYTRFDATHGLESNVSTWLTVPASAIGLDGQNGILGPFDQAHFLVRYRIPPTATLFGKLDIRLAAGFDIV
jgi:hypothetical protein